MIHDYTPEPMPPVHFVGGGEDNGLACWRQGNEGQTLLVLPFFPFSHLEIEWETRAIRRFYRGLQVRHQVIRFDWRGAGMSSRQVDDVSLEAQCRDIEAVRQHFGGNRIAILADSLSSLIAMRYAADHPGHVSHLILLHPVLGSADYLGRQRTRALMSVAAENWDVYADATALAHVGWQDADLGRKLAEIVRSSITKEFYFKTVAALASYEVASHLASILAKTVVLHRPACPHCDQALSVDIARRIPNAQLSFLTGRSEGLFDAASDTLQQIETFLSGDAVQLEAAAGGQRPAAEEERLTGREVDILVAIASGLSNKEIAARLDLSPFTVQRHVANIYQKIGIHNRAEATSFALRRQLVP